MALCQLLWDVDPGDPHLGMSLFLWRASEMRSIQQRLSTNTPEKRKQSKQCTRANVRVTYANVHVINLGILRTHANHDYGCSIFC